MNKTRFRTCFLLSILLHLLTLIVLITLPRGGKGNSKGQKEDNSVIVAKPKDSEVVEVDLTDNNGFKNRPKTPHENDKCKEFFGGIGVMQSGLDHEVLDAPFGYPAANAGIKVGDRILTPMDEIRGPIGSEIVIDYLDTNGLLHTVVLIRDKICTFIPRK